MLDTQDAEARVLAKKRLAANSDSPASAAAEAHKVDAPIDFGLLVPPGGDQGEQVDQFTLTLSQALKGTAKTGDAYATSRLKKVRLMPSRVLRSLNSLFITKLFIYRNSRTVRF